MFQGDPKPAASLSAQNGSFRKDQIGAALVELSITALGRSFHHDDLIFPDKER